MEQLDQYKPDLVKKIRENEDNFKTNKKVRFRPSKCMSTFQDITFDFEK